MNPVLSDSADELAGTEKVLSFFREQLLSGALKVGDRLLGERELCLALGVSRPVLREALRSLPIWAFSTSVTVRAPSCARPTWVYSAIF